MNFRTAFEPQGHSAHGGTGACGVAVTSLGHAQPEIAAVIAEQAEVLSVPSGA